MQFQADILGTPIRVASAEDVSARGAAFMAGSAAGLWGGEAELRELARPAAEYLPSMEAGRKAELLAGWQAALDKTFFEVRR